MEVAEIGGHFGKGIAVLPEFNAQSSASVPTHNAFQQSNFIALDFYCAASCGVKGSVELDGQTFAGNIDNSTISYLIEIVYGAIHPNTAAFVGSTIHFEIVLHVSS
jgi:hypothetical protein